MQNQTLANVLSRLDKVKKTGSGYTALCPAHNDKNPSLSIAEGDDGKVLLKCHAGCEFEDVLAAIGLVKADLYPPEQRYNKNNNNNTTGMEICYDYHDANGQLLFQVIRRPGKTFLQRQPNGQGGWVYNTKGVKPVLYRLPEVVEGIRQGLPVFLPEGEKDADNLRALGLLATTSPRGAKSWLPEYADTLKGADVIILFDNDDQGRRHMQDKVKSLEGKAKSIRVVDLPGLAEGGDISDWLASGHTKEELLELVNQTPEWRVARLGQGLPQSMALKEILATTFPEPVWVVPGLIPAGLTVLAGAPKIGKSWLSLCLGLALSSGGYALGKVQVQQAGAVYLALEDTAKRMQSRLNSLEINPSSDMHFLFEWERGALGAEQLDIWLELNSNIKLVIIDTLQRFRAPAGGSNIYAADYEAIVQLKQIADKHNIAIVVVHHTRKGAAVDPLEAVSGTFGITGGADTIATLTRARGEADAKLFVTGRDVEEQELALNLNLPVGWELLGEAKEYEVSRERREILDVFAKTDEALSPKEVADVLGKTANNVRFLIHALAKEGLLKNVSYGKYIYTTNTTNSANATNATNTTNT